MSARFITLTFHGAIEARLINPNIARRRRVLDEVVRHAECVVETEGGLSWQDPLRRFERLGDFDFQARQTVGQHRVKAIFFCDDGSFDHLAIGAEFGISLAHFAIENRDELVEEGLLQPEMFAVSHRAAHDLAQHVAASFVRGNDPVADQERRGARVIANDARSRIELVIHVAAVAVSADRADRLHDRAEGIDVVDGRYLLQNAREALETCAGIDRRRRQRIEGAVAVAIVLHEDQVPDLHRVVAGAVDQLRDVL